MFEFGEIADGDRQPVPEGRQHPAHRKRRVDAVARKTLRHAPIRKGDGERKNLGQQAPDTGA